MKKWLVFMLLLALSVSTTHALFTGNVEIASTPVDPNFSNYACIVYGEYDPPNCDLIPPSRFVNETEPVSCPGYPDDDDGVVIGLQTVYENIVDAIENCPYDPVLIEFTGTQYVYDGVGVYEGLYYNQTKDITIRGIEYSVTSGGDTIMILELQNVTHFNATSNTTYTVEEPVSVNVTTPVVTTTQQAAIVGFYQWQVAAQNISITFDNVLLEGCGADLPIFLTEAKPLRCEFPEPPIECCGAYFRQVDAETILNNGTCQRSGAYFDGYRYLRSDTNISAWETIREEGTIEFWVRPDPVAPIERWAGLVVVSHHHDDDDNDSGGFGVAWLNAEDPDTGHERIAFNVGQGDSFGVPTRAAIPRGQWSHVAGVFDNGVQSIYVNGELQDQITRAGPTIDYLNSGEYKKRFGLSIARAYSDSNGGSWRYFNGTFDEVRVWKEARSQAQIQALRYETLDTPSYPNLLAHFRFDEPFPDETDYYLNNLAAIAQSNPDLEASLDFVGDGGPHGFADPPAIPVCFCENPEGLCVANDLYQEFPYEAILTDYMDTCLVSDNCTFVHGMLIDPNGEFGRLWLPGLKQITGPSYNETIRFIPGRFEEQPYYMEAFNTTTNMTELVLNGTQPVFVPGAVADDLPYVDNDLYNMYTGFMPGWFVNDGFAPYWTGNFIPGLFFTAEEANMTYGIPLPVDYEEGDLVLVPGFREPDGSFYTTGGDITKNLYLALLRALLTIFGGVAFNFDIDTEPCELPTPPEIVELGMNMTLLEDEYGCLIVPGQEPPSYLDPSARDPCSLLAEIRAALPAGTESLPAEYVLGCNMTAFVEEPTYLDPSARDPCYVLQQLRDQITPNDTFRADCVAAGGTVAEPMYIGCSRNQNLTIIDSVIRNYYGEAAICQHSCGENTKLLVEYSVFENIPGSAIYSSGLQDYNVHDNLFCPCGGTADCVYLNANHISQGEFAVYNNRHCAVTDDAPVSCDYDISTTVRCESGILYCLDVLATKLNGCPFLQVTDTYGQFDSDCAVFGPCEFPQTTETVTLANGQQYTFNTTDGDIEINLPFLTPVLEELTGGNSSLIIPCLQQNQTMSVTYVDFEIQLVEYNNTGPYMNETTIVMEEVAVNVTETFTITGCAAAGELTCPCPFGWDPTTNITGVGSAGTTQTTCDIPIPDAPYGETCVDRVVWCPYEGGEYGTGQPPPVPVGLCDNGMAVVECNEFTCVGGQLYYEGVYHACDLGTCNVTGYTTVSCECDNGALDVVCDRSTCIGTPCPPLTVCEHDGGTYQNNTMTGMCECCIPSVNVTCANPSCTPVSPPMYDNSLCEVLDGMLTWDFDNYACYLPEGSTLCQGGSYVPSEPAPPDGYLTIPCDNSYEVPGPGPCSCSDSIDIGGNMTIPGNSTSNTGYLDDASSSTLACLVDGTLACRCDTPEGTNAYLANITSRPPDLNACAIHIDHIPAEALLWFQQNNVAQGLPYGWCFERFGLRHDSGWDLIVRFALKVPHFYTGHGIIYESRRLSPQVSGTAYDWVDGRPGQWNRRYCDPSLGEFFDPCHQRRPLPITEACLVNRLYNEMTPGWGVTHYNRIQDAILGNSDDGIAQCAFDAVIVEKSENFYEERLLIKRNNFWLGSYDRAVIVGSNHRVVGTMITLRGMVWLHPNTNDYAILVPANPSKDFDRVIDTIETGEQDVVSDSLTIQNTEFVGDGVNDIGALVGIIGRDFVFQFNLVRSFFVRAIDISADNGTVVQLNTFRDLTGRAFRGRRMQSYIFEENLFQECVGLNEGADVDIVSLEARTPPEYIVAPTDNAAIEAMFNFLLGLDYDAAALENALNPLEIEPNADIGCNANLNYMCYFRGNRQAVSDDQTDRSTVVFSFTGGGITADHIRDNMATHGHIGMKFVATPFISFALRSPLFLTNACVRPSITRQLNDRPYDFAFQPPGQFQWIGCAFPDCLSVDLFYPEMEVNPRHDLIITDYYGFAYVNNVTQCNTYSLELNACNITSGRARLRREDMLLRRNMYAIGAMDFPCCEKPVIQGNHLIVADLTAFEMVEYWYYFDLYDFEPGFELFRTQDEFSAYQIFFKDCCFDGRYYLYEFRSRMIDVHMREEDGDFAMIDCLAYNWWHYPEGTQLGFIEDESRRGVIAIVLLPNGDVFKWERSPDMDGVMVRYRPYTVVDINPFVIPQQSADDLSDSEFQQLVQQLGSVEAAQQYVSTQDGRTRLPIPAPTGNLPESFFTMTGNYFRDFDGNAVRVIAPGNIEFTDNTFHDCGMRQYEEHALLSFELNPDSVGDYVFESNYANQTKRFLFPIGGGDGNKIRFACIEMFEAGRPRRFRIWNTTCALLEDQPGFDFLLGDGEVADRIELYPKPSRSDGLFGNPFNLNSVTTDDIPVFDTTLEDITKTNLEPVLDDQGFKTTENTRVLSTQDSAVQFITGLGSFQLDVTMRGYTVGLRCYAIDRETLLKTLTPGRQNTTLFPFFQPGLYPLRVLANELNSINSTLLFAEGVYTPDTLPTNGPGIQGINADIIYCAGFEDALDGMFQECAVCNDGCPVIPPDSCIVDPGNGTFVPENPYYNRWIFTSINTALRECRDPNRRIKVVKQAQPYQLPWDLQGSNFTIFSNDGAQVKVSQHSVLIGGHDLTFSNITFLHYLGGMGPTVRPHGTVVPQNIFFDRCVFDGVTPSASTGAAIEGSFENFAFSRCDFLRYGGDHVVHINSPTCSIFEADDNAFYNAPGHAIYATGFDMAVVQQNRFEDCGGIRPNQTSVVYVEMCLESMVELVFADNWHKQDPNDVLYPRDGDGVFVSAYWLDSVTNRTGVILNLRGNEADGLPVGMRVTNYERQKSLFEGNDPRQDVRWVYAWNRNIAVYGTWHNVVVLPLLNGTSVAYFDNLIDADPSGTTQYYCDKDCGGVGGKWTSLIIFCASIIGFWIAFSICVCSFFMVNTRFEGSVYSNALDASYPADEDLHDEFVYANVGYQGVNPNTITPLKGTFSPRNADPTRLPSTNSSDYYM